MNCIALYKFIQFIFLNTFFDISEILFYIHIIILFASLQVKILLIFSFIFLKNFQKVFLNKVFLLFFSLHRILSTILHVKFSHIQIFCKVKKKTFIISIFFLTLQN